MQRADPDLKDEVVVFGPSAIGLMLTRLARLRGARRVFLVGSTCAIRRGQHRLAVGQQMGADVVRSARRPPPSPCDRLPKRGRHGGLPLPPQDRLEGTQQQVHVLRAR
jgi:threonine dehydrogenase-like Zn-dependent dehydrogenase